MSEVLFTHEEIDLQAKNPGKTKFYRLFLRGEPIATIMVEIGTTINDGKLMIQPRGPVEVVLFHTMSLYVLDIVRTLVGDK